MTNIIRLKSVTSTNDFLINQASSENLPDLTFLIAENQTNGRGFATNYWESTPGLNITTSGLFKPSGLNTANLYIFNMCISLAVSDTIKRFLPENSNIAIKWPNDIYVNDKKIAGILIECFFTDNKLDYIIAGIGLNVNQISFDSDAPNPISLQQINGQQINLEVCFSTLLECLQERYAQLKQQAFDSIISSYHTILYKRNEIAQFKANDIVFTGIIKRVEIDGKLVIEDEQKNELFFNFKEIEFC